MRTVTFTLFLLVVTAVSALAQFSTVVVFSEEGERFFVVLNGVRQNDEAQTNVRVEGLNQPWYTMKIIFEEEALGEVDKKITTQAVDFPGPTEAVWVVKKNKKGEYIVRSRSFVPIAQATPPPPTQQVVTYTAVQRAPVVSQTIVTEQTTIQSTNTNTDNVNVNVGMNLGGNSVGINMNINDGFGGTAVQSSQTVTSTQITTTEVVAADPVPVEYVPGYTGAIGCPVPMAPDDFQNASNSIGSKTFEDSKFTLAKQIFNTNCLTSQQVKQIMMLFDYEQTRLDFAKYAYGRTYDLGNYYVVNDAFEYELSIDDLNDFINGGF